MPQIPNIKQTNIRASNENKQRINQTVWSSLTMMVCSL